MCWLLPLSLGDQAHKWFTSLASYSIESFEKLVKLFLGHFTTMATHPITKCLANIRQGNKEIN